MLAPIKDISLCGLAVAALHQGCFHHILDLLHGGRQHPGIVQRRLYHELDRTGHRRQIPRTDLLGRHKCLRYGIFDLTCLKWRS